MKKELIVIALSVLLVIVVIFTTITQTGKVVDEQTQDFFNNIKQETIPEIPRDQSQTYFIDIESFEFQTKELIINKGDTVVWKNLDLVRHTVTSDSGRELDSRLLGKDQMYSKIFNAKGTFPYHCIPHPYMKGKIIVE